MEANSEESDDKKVRAEEREAQRNGNGEGEENGEGDSPPPAPDCPPPPAHRRTFRSFSIDFIRTGKLEISRCARTNSEGGAASKENPKDGQKPHKHCLFALFFIASADFTALSCRVPDETQVRSCCAEKAERSARQRRYLGDACLASPPLPELAPASQLLSSRGARLATLTSPHSRATSLLLSELHARFRGNLPSLANTGTAATRAHGVERVYTSPHPLRHAKSWRSYRLEGTGASRSQSERMQKDGPGGQREPPPVTLRPGSSGSPCGGGGAIWALLGVTLCRTNAGFQHRKSFCCQLNFLLGLEQGGTERGCERKTKGRAE
ncbi:hypothetical protein SKAU_G00223690 [Synaphobranchus kaupii]|uniref:Uncharacterized protein n=1 Tax=Synaphobranchus kaupii TaxID=118154 RepID=A0A9Q1FBG0_SYNKA|nr:hypothetical protein SKAU_G00223690 [Synaphobranchus kaupii]